MSDFRSYGNLTLAITAVLFFMIVPYLLRPICSLFGRSCFIREPFYVVSAAAQALDAAPTDECLLRYGSMLVIGIFFASHAELRLVSSTRDYWKETHPLYVYVAFMFIHNCGPLKIL